MEESFDVLMARAMIEYAEQYLEMYIDDLKELSKQYPNDLEFGGEVRRLLNK